jgi:hypothetical protein
MGATSKHYGDVYKWVSKVIESCKTQEQEKTARKLIDNYINNLYYNNEVHPVLRAEINRNLTCILDGISFSRIEEKLQNGNKY